MVVLMAPVQFFCQRDHPMAVLTTSSNVFSCVRTYNTFLLTDALPSSLVSSASSYVVCVWCRGAPGRTIRSPYWRSPNPPNHFLCFFFNRQYPYYVKRERAPNRTDTDCRAVELVDWLASRPAGGLGDLVCFYVIYHQMRWEIMRSSGPSTFWNWKVCFPAGSLRSEMAQGPST